MIGAYAAAATFGAVLGLRYKAGALVALSAVIVFAGTAAGPFMGWSILGAFAAAFGAAFALQCGYLLGLSINCASSRAKYGPRAGWRQVRDYGAALANARLRTR